MGSVPLSLRACQEIPPPGGPQHCPCCAEVAEAEAAAYQPGAARGTCVLEGASWAGMDLGHAQRAGQAVWGLGGVTRLQQDVFSFSG